jgi:hypothetical protein
MEPITLLTYIAVSHYSYYVVANFFDYIRFSSNFQSLHTEIDNIRIEIESLKSHVGNIEDFKIK